MQPWKILITIGLLCHMSRSFQGAAERVNNYHVEEGETVLLECPSVNCPTGGIKCTELSYYEKQDVEVIYYVWITDRGSVTSLKRPGGIFGNKPDKFKVLQDGRLKLFEVIKEFAGNYTCTVHFRGEVSSRDGKVCLDVLAEGEEPACKNKREKPSGSELEKKYIILIASLGGGLILLILFVFLIYKMKKRRDNRRVENNGIYGIGSSISSHARPQRSVCSGMPLPPTPLESSLNRHFSVDSGVSMSSISGYRPEQGKDVDYLPVIA